MYNLLKTLLLTCIIYTLHGAYTPLSLKFKTNSPICQPNTGAINLTVTGGYPPYSYKWSNNATTRHISNLAAKAYTVTVSYQQDNSSMTESQLVAQQGFSTSLAKKWYQSFVNTVPGYITHIYYVGYDYWDPTFKISTGKYLNGTILYSTTLPYTCCTQAWRVVAIPAPYVSVSANVTYSFGVDAPQGSASAWLVYDGNSYPSGSSGPTEYTGNCDFAFQVHVKAADTKSASTTIKTGSGWTCVVCPPGTYKTSSSCIECPAGTYQPANTTLSYCPSCPPGTTSSLVGATSCAKCAAGTYSSGGSLPCTTCAPGSYSAAGAQFCLPCPAGKYQSGAVCVNCQAGSYSNVGSSTCTLCPAGTKSSAIASYCTPCGAGRYAASIGSTACAICGAGRYSVAGSSACTTCPPGTTSAAGSTAVQNCR